MQLKDLNEAVTKTKYEKYRKVLEDQIEKNPNLQYDLLELDMNDEKAMNSFCEKVWGEPKGIYQNDRKEQHGLLRRLYDDKHKESGSLMRPIFNPIG